MSDALWAQEVGEDILRSIARIMGPSSAAQQALGDLARRRAVGEDTACYRVPGCPMFFVGPRMTPSLPPRHDRR